MEGSRLFLKLPWREIKYNYGSSEKHHVSDATLISFKSICSFWNISKNVHYLKKIHKTNVFN